MERVHDKIQSAHLEEKLQVNEVQLAPVLKEMPAVQVHTQKQADLDETLQTNEVEPTQAQEEIIPTQAGAPTRAESLQAAEEEPRSIFLPDWDNAAESPAQPEKVAPAIEPAKGVAGKMKNIFGKARPERLTTQAESVATEVQPQPTDEEKRSADVAQNKLGKIKNLFSKSK